MNLYCSEDTRIMMPENDQVSNERDDSIESYKKIRHPMKTLHGTPNGNFIELYSAVISPHNGDIAVSDRGSHTITLLDNEGNFKRDIGYFGSDEAEFNGPHGMDYDSNGDLMVADAGNHRIQIFDSEGNFRRKFSRYGRKAFQLNTPTDVCFSELEYCYYVCDYGNSRIQRFKVNGAGMHPTQLVDIDFMKPTRIKYDSYFNCFGVHHSEGFTYSTGEWSTEGRSFSPMGDIISTTPLAFSAEYAFVCKPADRPDITRIYHESGDMVHKFPSVEAICTQKPVIDMAVRNGRVVVVGSDFIEIY